MNIDLNDENMRSVIAEAVLKTITEDTRKTVLAASIENLLTPSKKTSPYGPKPISPLQEAFNSALHAIAREEVKKHLDADEVKTKIRDIIANSVAHLFDNKEESIVKISQSIADQLSRIDSY